MWLTVVLVVFNFTKHICWMKSFGNCLFHSTLPYCRVCNQFIHVHRLLTVYCVIIPQLIHSSVDGYLGCSWSFCCYKWWHWYKNGYTVLLAFKHSPLQWSCPVNPSWLGQPPQLGCFTKAWALLSWMVVGKVLQADGHAEPGFTLCASFLSRYHSRLCLLASSWKQLLHIFLSSFIAV